MDVKKTTCLIILIVLISGFSNLSIGQTTFVSSVSGNWNSGTTWVGGVVPGTTDNALISAGTTVSLAGTDVIIHNLTIAYEGVLNAEDRVMTVNGRLTVNGIFTTKNAAASDLRFNGDTIDGSGDIILNFPVRTVLINSSTVILESCRLFVYGNVSLGSAVTVNNLGRFDILGDLSGASSTTSVWTNNNNSYLASGGTLLATGILNASAPGNTVEYNMIGDQAILTPSASTYHNIIIRAAGNKIISSGLVINNDIRIDNSATLQTNNYNLGVGGNWTNFSNFNEGTGQVTFSGAGIQNIVNPADQKFHNLRINKTGGELLLFTNIIIGSTLTMTSGIINSSSFKTVLGTGPLAGQQGSLSYSGGYIKGKFERWINFSGSHQFPVGGTNPQRLVMTLVGLNAFGTLTAEFIPSDPGNNGLSLDDAGTVIYNTFVEGYWSVSAQNGFDLGFGNSYNLQLYGTGFTSFTIDPITRVLTRSDAGNNWFAEGSHQAATGVTARRTGLTSFPAQYALGDDTDCTRPVTSPITGLSDICSGQAGTAYSVVNNPSNTYAWTINGGVQVSGSNTSSIIVNWGATGTENASVSVVESNACTEGARVTLPVTINSIAPVTINGNTSLAEYSTGISYSVPDRPGYTYQWFVTGGTVSSGGNTSSITIDWGPAGSGNVTVIAELTGCNPAPPVMLDIRLYDVIQSVQSGLWNDPATWDCGCEPLPTQSVRISTGHTVTLHNSANIEINNLVIDAGAILDYNGNPFKVHGDLFVNGTYNGDASMVLTLDGIEKVIDGTGTIAGGFIIPSGSKSVASTASLTITTGDITIGGSVFVTNNGTIILNGNLYGTNPSTTWINAENSVLEITGELLATGNLRSFATGNSISYSGGASQSVKTPVNSIYHHLLVAGTAAKSLSGPVTINGNLLLGGTATLDATVNNYGINIRGDWTNTGTIFNPRSGRVTFDGNTDQVITGPEMFHNLSFTNLSGNLILNSNVVVRNNLVMAGNNIVTGPNILTIGVNAATVGSITYTSGTLVGKIERWANTFGDILFPVGTALSYNPANIYINIISSPGTVIAEFIPADPGASGLPLLDGTTDVRYHFSDGYWNLVASNGFVSGNYNIELVANNFTSDILNINTRILKRENSGDWMFDGSHVSATLPSVFRNFLTGGISALGTQFGLAFACAPYSVTGLVTATKCFGTIDGEIDISVAGATAPYSYIWAPGGETTEDITGLPAGAYQVTVTDARGCVTPEVFNVSQPAPLTIDEVVTDATCFGSTDGAIDISVEGGTVPYFFAWSTIDGSGLVPGDEDQTSLSAGTYTVLFQDINGCSTTKDITVIVTDVTPPLMTPPADLAAICDISEQASYLTYAEFVAAGGIAVDNCSINSTSFTLVSESGDGLSCPERVTRIYSIEDNNGNLATCTQSVVIYDIINPTASNPATITVQCSADVPSPDISVVTDAADNCTAVPVVAFLVDATDGNNCPETITRSYSVTDDCGNSITVTQLIVIDDTTPPVITGCPADISVNSIPGSCSSVVNWIPPLTTDNCGIAAFTSSHSPGDIFPAGTTIVTYTATDNCGNISTCSFNVTVTDNIPPLAICQNITIQMDASCLVTILPSDIDAGSTDDCGIASISVSPNTFTCADIGINTVTLTVTDVNGNISTCNAFVTVNDGIPPVINCPVNQSRDNTPGSCDYTVSGTEFDPTIIDNSGTATVTNNFNGLPSLAGAILPGGVTIVVWTATDASGNMATCLFDITINDVEAPVLVTKDAVVDIGAGNVAVIDSSFVWNNTLSSDNCAIVRVTLDKDTFDCTELGDNIINVTASDAAGNVTSSTATVTVNDPSVTNAFAGPDENICILDGSITISGSSVTNGTVNWGTDGNGTFDDPSLLNPTYTLGATDTGILKLYMDVTANIGCKTATDTMLLTIYGIPAVDAGPDIDVCAGDSDVPVSGATYSDGIISWTTSGDGTFDDAAIINPVYTFGVSDTGPVTLTITVTSPGSCGIVSDNLVVNFVPGPVTDAGGDDAVCATTAAYPVNDASYSGGTVLWTTGGDGTFDDATSGSPLYTFGVNDIGAGTVTLTMTVTSTGTCGADIDDKILTLWPSPVIVLDEHSDISCNGLTDGIIRISGGGSTAPYQYSINGGAYQLSGDFTLLGAGDYDLSVIDANGCIHDTTVTIVDPELFAYTFDGYSDNTCFGANDGSISITITGGTLPYAINWTGPNGYASTDEDISGLEPGSYSLNLTDANTCSLFTLNQDIGSPPEIVITPVAVSDYNGYGVSCNGGNNGFIEADVSGGTGTLTTIWTGPNGFSSSDEDISGLEAGNYILTVTDATSCPVIYSVILTEPAELSVTYDVTDASCPGDANGQIDLFVTGGVLPYIFMWDDNNPNEDRNDILPGDYSVDITDANGCEEQIFITVGVIGYNCVVVPEVITPGVVDGKNDEVIIKNIDMFPEAEIKIFTRWGKLIFSAKNLADNRWNGTYEGKLMPVDSYHYILDLKDGSKPLTGTITIIR